MFPQETGLKKTVPTLLLGLFKDALGNFIKGWYEGDPIIVPQSKMPAIIVSETRTAYGLGATGMDTITHEILIQLVFNKKDDLGKPDNEATLERKLDNLAQGRNETTGEFVDNSIMGVLRKNLTLGNLSVETISSVEKGVVDRAEELVTAEAHIRVTIEEFQTVTNRT